MDKEITIAIREATGTTFTIKKQNSVNYKEFVKTKKEKKRLKKLKSQALPFSEITGSNVFKRHNDLCVELKVYLKPSWRRPKQYRNNFKSVISIKCKRSEVYNSINFAKTANTYKDSKEDEVIKVTVNGKLFKGNFN